ncbi:MAG: hypothetical protein HY791_03015 [Deltaproteobacteria bacterium]|nr:hypothetical protein [Deltaproteobacteria bacterium]
MRAALTALLFLCSCATESIRGTGVLATDKGATHIWVIVTDSNGDDRVYYCDANRAIGGEEICTASSTLRALSRARMKADIRTKNESWLGP